MAPMSTLQTKLRNSLTQPSLASVAMLLWALTVGVGWAAMARYEFSVTDDGPTATGPWPEGLVERSAGRPALVVCLHPKCPCSQATLSELERLLAKPVVAAQRPEVLAVLAIPRDADDSWTSAALVERCQRLPGARIQFDCSGRIAAAFGATTSGEVRYFDSAGECRFAGGVTISRGHEGASAGSDALAALLGGAPCPIESTPVFGCRLVSPTEGALRRCVPTSAPFTQSLRAVAHLPEPWSLSGE